jgi:hypothetical protein
MNQELPLRGTGRRAVLVDPERIHYKKREDINHLQERPDQPATRDDPNVPNIIEDIVGPGCMFMSFARASVAIQELFVARRNFLLVILISRPLTGIRSLFNPTNTEDVVPEWRKITDYRMI